MTIWQHVPFEDEAAIGEWAQLRGVTYKMIRCWENEVLEADELLVILGGSMSAYDELDFISNEVEFLRQRIKDGGKVFGICLGAQLLARAMGAKVYASNTLEAGWREVTLLPHALTQGITPVQQVLHWHGDTFDLPHNTQRLASNDAFINQAFATPNGHILATQFHFETTQKSMQALLDTDGGYLKYDSPFVADAQTIQAGARHIPNANQTLFTLLDRWAGLS